MKRIIKVTATYDLNDPELKGLQITPKEKVKEMVTKQMIEAFGWDEGYCGVKVEVIDTPIEGTYKCEHSRYECPYKDCNYHVNSTGKYSHTIQDEIPYYLPFCEDDAKICMSYMDI